MTSFNPSSIFCYHHKLLGMKYVKFHQGCPGALEGYLLNMEGILDIRVGRRDKVMCWHYKWCCDERLCTFSPFHASYGLGFEGWSFHGKKFGSVGAPANIASFVGILPRKYLILLVIIVNWCCLYK